MQKPWLALTIICSLVLGILLFCVIMGGYTSLLRSKNRIHTAKQMLSDQCARQIDLALELADPEKSGAPDGAALDLTHNANALKAILPLMVVGKDPMAEELVTRFQDTQNGLTRLTDSIMAQSAQSRTLAQKAGEIKTQVRYMIHQYNQEARYFNTRRQAFPVMFSARLFGLDQLQFPEIPLPPASQETSSAS